MFRKILSSVVLVSGLIMSLSVRTNADPSVRDGGDDHEAGPGPSTTPVKNACPDDMVEIEGDYCPQVREKCLYNVDIDGIRSAKPVNDLWSCGEFQVPTVCTSSKLVHMHYCIDKYEWPNKKGQVPQDWMTWYDAKKAVESVGKRLCTAREWTLAAEGPNMHPLPYGDGFHRNQMCNIDNHMPKGMDVFKSRTPNDETSQELRSLLVPSGSKPDCHSDYGVYDMAGNIDEFVVNEGGTTCVNKSTGNCISGLKGGHVWHVRQAARPMTTAHGEGFGWYETGTRACKDAE